MLPFFVASIVLALAKPGHLDLSDLDELQGRKAAAPGHQQQAALRNYKSTTFNSNVVKRWWNVLDGGKAASKIRSDHFDFPFYGQDFRRVGISDEGFISTRSRSFSGPLEVDAEYVAPFMPDAKEGGARQRRSLKDIKNKVKARLHSPKIFFRMESNDSTFYIPNLCRSNCQGVNEELDAIDETVKTLSSGSDDNRASSFLTKLPFLFTFYGRSVDRVYVTTGGFLSVGQRLHDKVHLVQYIAPLRANYRMTNGSFVKSKTTSSEVVVEWDGIVLEKKPDFGRFTFRVVLSRNGTIFFVYKELPESFVDEDLKVHGIGESEVVAGMSDAVESGGSLVTFHRMSVSLDQIGSGTVVRYVPSHPCHLIPRCQSCLAVATCVWCPGSRRCGSKGDEHPSCDAGNVTNPDQCTDCASYVGSNTAIAFSYKDPCWNRRSCRTCEHTGKSDIISTCLALLAMLISVACAITIFYGYVHPTSMPGSWIVKIRMKRYKLMNHRTFSERDEADTILDDSFVVGDGVEPFICE